MGRPGGRLWPVVRQFPPMNTYAAIYAVVQRIPPGRVSSYGRVALLAGLPGQARLVGYALHALQARHADDVPWWRVINRNGFISNAYAAALQRERLESEGVVVDSGDRIDLARFLWDGDTPDDPAQNPPHVAM